MGPQEQTINGVFISSMNGSRVFDRSTSQTTQQLTATEISTFQLNDCYLPTVNALCRCDGRAKVHSKEENLFVIVAQQRHTDTLKKKINVRIKMLNIEVSSHYYYVITILLCYYFYYHYFKSSAPIIPTTAQFLYPGLECLVFFAIYVG